MPTQSTDQDDDGARTWWQQLCSWLWKISGFLGTAILLSLSINILSTWLTSSKGILPPDSPLAALLTHWPLLLAVGWCLLLLAILAKVLSREPTRATINTGLTAQNHERMLQRLRRSYRELNAQSLQGTVWLELGLADKPGAVQNTTNLVLHASNQPEQVLPAGTSIEQVYEEAAHELLILGEPGAGKSVLLYHLAQALVEHAEKDITHPLPILLPLSSWAVKRPALEVWIEEQLSSPLYDIPHKVSQQWIQDKHILPLLDGLDEIEESARSACILAINRYHHEHLNPLVVCSRTTEYKTASSHEQLNLQSAVVVRPLTREQVNASLVQAGKPLAALRSELKKNTELQALIRSPLWLNILLLTYQSVVVQALPKRREALKQQIFANYVAHMVGQKGNLKLYPFHQTMTWLSWLAKGMQAHHQSTFYLEELQLDWLTQRFQHCYQWSVRLVNAVLGFLLGGLLNQVSGGALNGLIGGLLWMPLFILYFGRNLRIKPMETLGWSQESAQVGLLVGLISGLIFNFVYGFLLHDLTVFLSFIPAFVFAGILYFGLTGKQLPQRDQLTPNEGIRRSATVGLLSALPLGLTFGLLSELVVGVVGGIVIGVFCIIFTSLARGLQATMRHFILRFWLWYSHVFPWKVVMFLNYATSHILLQRVGGGYSFTHRLLLEYFANLKLETATPSANVSSTQFSHPEGQVSIVRTNGTPQ